MWRAFPELKITKMKSEARPKIDAQEIIQLCIAIASVVLIIGYWA
jgi:hypothetical protein